MNVTKVRDARALAAIEQAIGGELPAGWRQLEPPRNREREAAAVLLRLAEQSDLAAMTTAAKGARQAGERKHDSEAGEKTFWKGLHELLAAFEEPAADRPPSLAGLALWAGGPVPALIDGIDRDLRGATTGGGPVASETLAALARIVLRARARAWLVTERGVERQSEPGDAS